MTPEQDERLGLPSASSIETDALCPGRQNLLKTLPPEAFKKEDDSDADRGTRIHKARETGDASTLDDDDLEIYKKGMATERRVVYQWQNDFQIPTVPQPILEERLFLHWPDTMTPAASARLDVAYVIPGVRGSIVEMKSLWCSNLTAAELNWQGRTQAVLLANEYSLQHVRVAFNKAMFGQSDIVDYGPEDLKQAEHAVFHALYETKNPYAQRRAGPHCRYCPGQAYCIEAASMALLPTVQGLVERSANGIADNSFEAMAARLSPEDLSAIHSRAGTIAKILEAVKLRLKTFPSEQLGLLGWTLAEGRKMDYILETKAAFDHIKDELKMSDKELWAAMSFSKGDLVNAIQRDTGVAKEKAAGYAKQIVSKFGETKQSEPSLKRL